MDYYKLILTLLTIIVGFLTIALLVWKTKSSSSRTFEYLSAVLFFFNLWLIFTLVFVYFKLHIMPSLLTDTAILLNHLYFFVSRMIQLFLLYFVVKLVWEILSNERTALKKNILKGVVLFFCVLLILGFLSFLFVRGDGFFHFTQETAGTVVQWGSLIYMLILCKNAWSIKDTEKRFSLLFVSVSWVLFLMAIVFLSISGNLNINRWLFGLPIEISLDFTISLINLWWIWKYSNALTDNRITPVAGDVSNAIELLASQLDITRREQEIIDLICKGSSNQEIADLLFISLRTVKAHIYNIFQKTGVKNRLQLANMFAAKN